MPEITVAEASLEEALAVLASLPEFDTLKPRSYYEKELTSDTSLILVARINGNPAGCKLGYDRFKDGSFYSWLGGVIPQYRKTGVARALAEHQEKWAVQNGFSSVKFKTQNRHRAMLHFALKNGFSIYNVKPKEALAHYRIELIKLLT